MPGPWSAAEDALLVAGVEVHGEKAWAAIAQDIEGRCRRSCRDRWQVYSRSRNHSPMSTSEQAQFVDLHRELGSQWKRIAEQLPERSALYLKNLFATRRRGRDPGGEPLLFEYARGGAPYTLRGLYAPLVLGVLESTRDSIEGEQWCGDVRVWRDICVEMGGAVYLDELVMDPPTHPLCAEVELEVALDMHRAAATVVGHEGARVMLVSAGDVGLVGILHADSGVAAALGQLTCRLWQLERRLPPSFDTCHHESRRLTM